MLRNITLYGDLGEKFGKYWRLDVSSPSEATRAIDANKPGFIKYILEREYHVLIGGKELENPYQLLDPIGSKDITIIPAIQGSKNRGLSLLIIGALIVFAPYIVTSLSHGTALFGEQTAMLVAQEAGMSFMTSPFMMKLGAGLMFQGVAQLLAPKPTKPESSEVDNGQSYSFNGPVNTVSQGLPIPICYGELIVGGALISASVTSEDI